jgi:hypothetical protein
VNLIFMRARFGCRLESPFRRAGGSPSELRSCGGPDLAIASALIVFALLGTGCAAQGRAPSDSQETAKDELPSLRPLGEGTSADFRRVFDEAQGKTRFIVALSPT